MCRTVRDLSLCASWDEDTNTQVSCIISVLPLLSQGHLGRRSQQNTLLMMWMFFSFSVHKLPALLSLCFFIHLQLSDPNYADSISPAEQQCPSGWLLYGPNTEDIPLLLNCRVEVGNNLSVIIRLNSWRYQVRRSQWHHGKTMPPVCSLYFV